MARVGSNLVDRPRTPTPDIPRKAAGGATISSIRRAFVGRAAALCQPTGLSHSRKAALSCSRLANAIVSLSRKAS